MGILDWFKNRPGQFDPQRISAETVQWAVEKAVALTNPRLKLLPDYRQHLAPAVATTIEFLRAQVALLPAVHPLAAKYWSVDPALRAFFVEAADITVVLGGSNNLRALFEQHPTLDEACVVLGMAFRTQGSFGMALQGDTLQRDVAQTTVNFSDHRARICERDELLLRRVIGVEVFEYLVGQALTEIGTERTERQELQRDCALIRARLRLLQQHGPGLASMFGAEPAEAGEQAKLGAELLENEQQLQALGGSESVLEIELACLAAVLGKPQRYLHFAPQRLRLNAMNVVVDENSTERAAAVDFAVIEANGSQPVRRAFILARVARADLPPPQRMNFATAARYL
jgi:hypothetical protein